METTAKAGGKEEPVLWYVLRAVFSKELAVKEELDKLGVETFVPMRYQLKKGWGGVKVKRILVPVIHDLVFVHATKSFLEGFKARFGSTLYFMTEVMDARRRIIVVPEHQMNEFIRIARQVEEDILYFRPEEIRLEKGDRVRVHGGKFDGVEGVLLKVKGKRSKRVVVKIAGVAAIAASYIEPELIEVLEPSRASTDINEDMQALAKAAEWLCCPKEEEDGRPYEEPLLRNEVKRLFRKLADKQGLTVRQEASLCVALMWSLCALPEVGRQTEVTARCRAVLPQLKDEPLKELLRTLLRRACPGEEAAGGLLH